MQSSAPSPAPSKSTGIGGDSSGGATAVQLAATRGAINAEYAEESEKSQDAVMGDLSQIDFQRGFKAAAIATQLKIDLSSKSDQIPISKLNTLLKLMASGALKEVDEKADLLSESMTTTATANKAVVTSLNTVAVWNEKERERLEDVIALAKGNTPNFSLSEKIFLAAQASYATSHCQDHQQPTIH